MAGLVFEGFRRFALCVAVHQAAENDGNQNEVRDKLGVSRYANEDVI